MRKKEDWIIYEIYIRSFYDSNHDGIGDLQGIIEKLDYLEDLGINALWITPIFVSDLVDSGYDINNYYEINPDLGDLQTFKTLIEEAKKRDIKILLDIALNHTSHRHLWFKKSLEKDARFGDFYIWKKGKNGKEPNNWYSSNVGGSSWTYRKERDQYYLHTYSPEQPDLNWNSPLVRQEIVAILKFWLDLGIGGVRLDVINKIGKEPGFPDVPAEQEGYFPAEQFYENHPLVHDYLKELCETVFSQYPDRCIIGQTPGVDLPTAKRYIDEDGLDLILQFEIVHIFKKPKLQPRVRDYKALKDVIIKWYQDNHFWNTNFFANQDSPRLVSYFGNDDCSQKVAKLYAGLTVMLKGTPIIYQGDEIGIANVYFDNLEDYPDIRTKRFFQERVLGGTTTAESYLRDIWKVARDHARQPMLWSDQFNAGFSDATPWMKINEHYQTVNTEKSDGIVNFYKQLIQLRKNYQAIACGDIFFHESHDTILSFCRIHHNDCFRVVANLSDNYVQTPIELEDASILLNNYNSLAADVMLPFQIIISQG